MTRLAHIPLRRLSTPFSYRAPLFAVAAALLAASACSNDSAQPQDLKPGQTDFETEQGSGNQGRQNAGEASTTTGGAPSADASKTAAPSGRTGPVEEADIYRVDQNRLFYLNTYRGLLIYDINDVKKPRQVSRLPVFGYPVEMFVQGNTVYALLSDVLYMTQEQGKVQFKRHNVSQLVAIDITDIANPRVLKTVDIVGQLREGVSRKIDDTIYVVSYIPQAYYWGWRYELTDPQKEQAWVYSFNVADPSNLQKVQQLKIFEGGSIAASDPITGGEVSRYFSNVAISATSNALMVVENWHISSWSPGTNKSDGSSTCGSYAGDQRAIVSLVDISDPTGVIRLHARFQTRGTLGDQFKQTYVHDDTANTGTYYGIFARQGWRSTNCSGESFVQNTFESWDVSTAGAPARLNSLDFGKPNETVRGTAYDVTRKAAYAITAQQIDPLYVLSFADRTKLTIRSSIDGLSGDMSLFRLVENNNYLVGIGRDASETCSGAQGNESRRNIGIAVSLIDVRNLDAIRLVQRQCVAVDGEWVSSDISWNLDQAHKMIGMQSDGTTNVITVPVSYSKRVDNQGDSWWWYTWQTAVGIMSWDLSQYDPAKSAPEQKVIKNYGTYLHPNGEVRRSIVFTHQEATPRRMMINLSDTHISVADIQDLANPVGQSVVEVAPYIGQIFQFGDYVVESVSDSPHYWAPQNGMTQFRVKQAGAALDAAPVVAHFSASQVQSVARHGDKLVIFRQAEVATDGTTGKTNMLVFDLSNPRAPKLVANTNVTGLFYPYYPFYCGVGWGFWFGYGQANWTDTRDALVFMEHTWDAATNKQGVRLTSIGLVDAANPTVTHKDVLGRENGYFMGLIPDASDSSGFYLSFADYTYQNINGTTSSRTRNYAQRFHAVSTASGVGWEAEQAVNLPGQLVRSWVQANSERAYLTSDYVNYTEVDAQGGTVYRTDTRLNLLRAANTAGRAVAELRDTYRFPNQYVGDLVIKDASLFVNASPAYYTSGGIATSSTGAVSTRTSALTVEAQSDRLIAFDLGKLSFRKVYDQPTGTQGVQFMGTNGTELFANVAGDGILAIDVADPAHPVGRQFLRTLGWATHIVFAADSAYVAAGYFGVYRMDLKNPMALPATQ